MHRRILIILLSAGSLAAAPSPPQPASDLEGLWGASHRFGPQARGILIVDGRSQEWVAHIGGFDLPVRTSGDSVSILLPNQLGEFRGLMAKDRASIRGHWFQPPTAIGGSFASPVKLASISENVWKGVVSPLRDELNLYLVVNAATNGTFIRNPEANFAAGRSYTVERSEHAIALGNAGHAPWNIEGAYDAAADRLTLDIPLDIGAKRTFVAFDFLRQTRDEAQGFYPRRSESGLYQYRPPIQTDDGWQTSALEDAGMRTKPVSDAIEGVVRTLPTDAGAPSIQAVLAARHGKLVLEEYFYGFDQARLHDLRSAGNSIMSALVGIAIDHGATFGLGTPVYPLFPEYTSIGHPDPRKARITVQDLLAMNSGLAGDDADESSPGNEERMLRQRLSQPDYYKFALDLPMAADPGGTQAVKFTAGINLLGGIVRNATGGTLIDFFARDFARPLDIQRYYLNLTPSGDLYGGGGLYLLPRDALKLGQVYLDGGTWNSRRIVSRKWVELSTRRYSGFGPGHGYGLAWHLYQLEAGGRTYSEFEAQGNGGQVISVIPELDLVVMFTTGNYDEDETAPERAILAAIIGSVR